MRRISFVVAVVGGILIVGLAAIWALANPNRHREAIQSLLEKQFGRKATLGEMSLGLLPLRFQVENAVVAEDPSIQRDQPFVRADKLDVRVLLLPLLRGSIQVTSLELTRPSVELVRTKEGAWNFSTLGKASAGPDAGSPSNSAGTEFTLDRLTIVDGQVGLTDLQKGTPRTVYDHIDLMLLDYAAGKPFSFDLAAHLQGEGAQELRLTGEGGPVSATSPADTPFHGTLDLNQVGIEDLMKFLDTQVVTQAKGILSGESEIASQSGNVTASGKLNLEQAQINGLNIGYPIALDYNLAARIAEGLVTINNGTLQLGQTPLAVTGLLNTAATPVDINLHIKSGDVSILEIARLASAFGVAFAPGTSVTGRVSADVQARGPATQPVVTGSIAGRDLEISGEKIPQPVQVKAVDLALSPTAIQSKEFNATSGKTTVAARFSLLQYASGSPSADVGLRASGATLPEIQAIARAYGLAGLDRITGDGMLNFDLRASGPLQSLTTAAAMKALNGEINLDFSPLKILGFDTAHELGKLGGFASSLTEQTATDIVKLAGRIVVKNGVAQTSNLKAQLGIGSLAADGTADLAAESLNLGLTAVFSKEFSAGAGSSRAGGLMNVAFSNAAGEIVLPAIVTGTFTQPKFAPDLKAAAQLQKQKFIPTLDNPAGAITNILGAIKEKPEGTATEEQPAGPKPSIVKGILGALGGKKSEEPK